MHTADACSTKCATCSNLRGYYSESPAARPRKRPTGAPAVASTGAAGGSKVPAKRPKKDRAYYEDAAWMVGPDAPRMEPHAPECAADLAVVSSVPDPATEEKYYL